MRAHRKQAQLAMMKAERQLKQKEKEQAREGALFAFSGPGDLFPKGKEHGLVEEKEQPRGGPPAPAEPAEAAIDAGELPVQPVDGQVLVFWILEIREVPASLGITLSPLGRTAFLPL